MMNLCDIFQTRNILSYLISQRKWGGIMKILFTKIYPYLVDAVSSVRLGLISVKT